MNSMQSPEGARGQVHRLQRRGWPIAASTLTVSLAVAALASSCAVFDPRPASIFTTLADTLPAVIAQGNGYCVGLDGGIAACSPRPQPKRLALDGLRVDLLQPGNPSQANQPAYAFCKVVYGAGTARLDCAEIYTRPPG